jgi:hypothetical protein
MKTRDQVSHADAIPNFSEADMAFCDAVGRGGRKTDFEGCGRNGATDPNQKLTATLYGCVADASDIDDAGLRGRFGPPPSAVAKVTSRV